MTRRDAVLGWVGLFNVLAEGARLRRIYEGGLVTWSEVCTVDGIAGDTSE